MFYRSIILIVLCCLPETVQFFVHSLYYLVFSVYCLQLFSVRFFAHCPLFNFLSTFFCPLSTVQFFVHCPLSSDFELEWGGGVLTYPEKEGNFFSPRKISFLDSIFYLFFVIMLGIVHKLRSRWGGTPPRSRLRYDYGKGGYPLPPTPPRSRLR